MLKADVKRKAGDFTLQVSFTCDKKRIGIVGASGCGKSMMLKALAGIIPCEGIIQYEDTVLLDSKKRICVKSQNRHIGYVFQNYALFPNMDVMTNIACGLGKQVKEQTVSDILKQFQLEDVRHLYPKQLSGGQQQRAALARALAGKPKLVLLDEPFSALDSHLKDQMRRQLHHIMQTYDGTFVLVTHDVEEAYQFCDWLLLMENGKIIQSGPVEEVFAHPLTVQAARLVGCKNISRVQILDGKHVMALDWNNHVITMDVKEGMTHVGIRSSDILPAENMTENTYRTAIRDCLSLPEKRQITLQDGLIWELPNQKQITDCYLLQKSSLLPLK